MPSWLVLTVALNCAWIPNQTSFGGVGAPTQNVYSQTMSFELIAFNHLFLGSDLETRDQCANLLGWCPFQSRYRAFAGIKFGPVTLRCDHECIHPTLSKSGKIYNSLITDETKFSLELRKTF